MNEVGPTYTVQSGDTLASISIMFDIPVDHLRRQNKLFSDNIFPGDTLSVRPPLNPERIDPIQAGIFNPKKRRDDHNGTLYILGDTLRFESQTCKPLNLPLLGHIESAILPHPHNGSSKQMLDFQTDDSMFFFIYTFLMDPYDDKTLTTYYFSVTYGQIKDFFLFFQKTVEEVQRAHNYAQRDPDSLPREQSISRVSHITSPSPPPEVQNRFAKIRNKNPIMSLPPTRTPPVRIRPRATERLPDIALNDGMSNILSDDDILKLRRAVPHRYVNHNWTLLYQISRDGCSYRTFYMKTERKSPVLFALKSDTNERFGAYISTGFKLSKNYYGSGETFIFKLDPTFQPFKWSEANQYFISTSENEIAIGGGGASAIWIDGHLFKAFSEPCPTFGSPSLTSKIDFKIIDLEVWLLEP